MAVTYCIQMRRGPLCVDAFASDQSKTSKLHFLVQHSSTPILPPRTIRVVGPAPGTQTRCVCVCMCVLVYVCAGVYVRACVRTCVVLGCVVVRAKLPHEKVVERSISAPLICPSPVAKLDGHIYHITGRGAKSVCACVCACERLCVCGRHD